MRAERGFTFVELVISLVVIAIAVAGVLLVFTQTVSRSAEPMIRQQALAIAEAYLEEILSRRHSDPDGADGETLRAEFDDVDDYHGLNDSPPRRPDGSAISPALDGYAVSVTVSDGSAELGVTARRIEVTVLHGGAEVFSLWGFRADYD